MALEKVFTDRGTPKTNAAEALPMIREAEWAEACDKWAEAALPSVRLEDVLAAYSGKPGCACGCRGTYWGASIHKAELEAEYHLHMPAIGDRQVKRILDRVQAAPKIFGDGHFFSTNFCNESRGQVYTIYLTQAGQKDLRERHPHPVRARQAS